MTSRRTSERWCTSGAAVRRRSRFFCKVICYSVSGVLHRYTEYNIERTPDSFTKLLERRLKCLNGCLRKSREYLVTQVQGCNVRISINM